MNRAFLALALGGCGWNHLPHGQSTESEPLWDPRGVVATTDGLYVPLPASGGLALIEPDGTYGRVDVGEGRVTRTYAAPDARSVLAFVERYFCRVDAEERKKIDRPDQCDAADLETETELSLIVGGRVKKSEAVSGAYNQVAFTNDGQHAVAFLDLTQEIDVQGVLNLTAVVVVDLVTGDSELVPVGFAVDRVLFVENENGAATRAVVVSRNQVGVVDLTQSPPKLIVTFPLTLDPDTIVDPIGVDLTPDGRYALISVQGSADLYALDLELQAINIVELASNPSAMAVDGTADRTVLTYAGASIVQLLDHDQFETRTLELDEAMNHIVTVGDQAVLWSDGSQHDLYRVDIPNNDVVEYRLQNPATSVTVAPTGEYAVVLTRAEGGSGSGVDALYDQHPGMEIVDLRTNDTEPFLLVGDGVGVALAADDTHLNALVLQEGVDSLFRLDLYTRETEDIDLEAPPVAIGDSKDGRFWITHESALGLISFLDPATGEVSTVGGFGALGLLDPIELQEEK